MKRFFVLMLTFAMLLGCTSLFVSAEQTIMGSIYEGAVGHAAMMTIWSGGDVKHSIQDMDYLEFEVYLSDPAYVKDIPFCFELTSSGTCDHEEDSFFGNWVELGATQKGWNTVRIPLSMYPAKGCDRTRVNFLRIFSDEAFALPQGAKLEYYFRKVAFGTEAEGDKDSKKRGRFGRK